MCCCAWWDNLEVRRVFLFGFFTYWSCTPFWAFTIIHSWNYLKDVGISDTDNSISRTISYLNVFLGIPIGIFCDKNKFWMPWVGEGHRVPYMLLGFIIKVISTIVLAFVPPTSLTLYTIVNLIINLAGTLILTCYGGLNTIITPPGYETAVQGTILFTGALGIGVHGLILGFFMASKQYELYFLVMAAVSFPVALVGLYFVNEGDKQPETFKWEAFNVFCGGSKLRLVWMLALFFMFNSWGWYYVLEVGPPSIETIYKHTKVLAGVLGGIAALCYAIGAAMAACAQDNFGYLWALVVITIGKIASYSGSAVVMGIARYSTEEEARSLTAIAIVIVSFQSMTFGCANAIVWGMAMLATEESIASSFWAILVLFSNMGSVLSKATAGVIADTGDRNQYHTVYWVGVLLVTIVAPFIPFLTADTELMLEEKTKGNEKSTNEEGTAGNKESENTVQMMEVERSGSKVEVEADVKPQQDPPTVEGAE